MPPVGRIYSDRDCLKMALNRVCERHLMASGRGTLWRLQETGVCRKQLMAPGRSTLCRLEEAYWRLKEALSGVWKTDLRRLEEALTGVWKTQWRLEALSGGIMN